MDERADGFYAGLRTVRNRGVFMRHRLALAAVAVVAVVGALTILAADVLAGTTGAFTYAGRVVHVVDGDTIDVALKGSSPVRVRVIGIDTPEVGTCYADAATRRMTQLTSGKAVLLHGDPTQATHDRYSRLLAYVDVGSVDAGATLVREGYARVYVYDRPFRRVASYYRAEGGAKQGGRGLWKACGSPVKPTPKNCDPSYPDVCIPSPPPDLDCKDVQYRSFRVLQPDPHHFDGNRDGYGCEG